MKPNYDIPEDYRRIGVGAYQPLKDAHLQHLVRRIAPTVSSSLADCVVRSVKSRVADPGHFAVPSMGVAFLDGFVHVSGDGIRLLQHHPNNRALVSLPFSFVGTAGDPDISPGDYLYFGDIDDGTDGDLCPAFHQFFSDVFGESERDAVQEFIGLALLGCVPKYGGRALILYGPRAAGLSHFLRLVVSLFPAWSVVSTPLQELRRGRLDNLIPALLNIVIDMAPMKVKDPNLVGAVVSGLLPGGPRCAHLMTSGRLPDLGDVDDALLRSLMFFKVRQPEGCVDLSQLEAELPGFVIYCLRGAVRAIRNLRITLPEGYKQEMLWEMAWGDDVRLFIKFCCKQASRDSERVGVTELFNKFTDWCSELVLGEDWRKIGLREFTRRVEEFGYTKRRLNRSVTFDLEVLKQTEWGLPDEKLSTRK